MFLFCGAHQTACPLLELKTCQELLPCLRMIIYTKPPWSIFFGLTMLDLRMGCSSARWSLFQAFLLVVSPFLISENRDTWRFKYLLHLLWSSMILHDQYLFLVVNLMVSKKPMEILSTTTPHTLRVGVHYLWAPLDIVQ